MEFATFRPRRTVFPATLPARINASCASGHLARTHRVGSVCRAWHIR